MSSFQDHFSARSVGYAAYRPTYPAALFEWLAAVAPGRGLAWDCATGSGQAAAGLSPLFQRVVATDASADQLRNAKPFPNVEYRVATAEASGLNPGEADLITVAQALHWFDRPTFFTEARRVARPGGILAIWTYNVANVSPAIDRLLERFYTETVGPYWPGDRVLVNEGYRNIEVPFEEFTPPEFSMEAEWTLEHLLGYLRTWSAVARYSKEQGHDPVADLAPELTDRWGTPDGRHRIRWPLSIRVAKL